MNDRTTQLELTVKFNNVTAVVTPSERHRMLIICEPMKKEPVSALVQPVSMPIDEVEQLIINGNYNVGHALTTRQIDVDFDTDNILALRAFNYFLPTTPYRLGRKSKPDSHWIYNLPEDYFERANEYKFIVDFLARRFQLGNEAVKIEYRYRTHKDNDFNSRLSAENPYVFAPGSIHPSGEMVTWAKGINLSLTATNFDVQYLFKQTALAIIAALIVPYWSEGSRQYMSMALAGTLHRMNQVHGEDDDKTKGVHYTALDFEALVKGICTLANDNEVGPRLQTFKQTWRKAEHPDTKTTGATSLKRYLGDDAQYILNTMFQLIAGTDESANVQEIYEQFCLYRGTGHVIDTKRMDPRNTWIMKKDGFVNTYASHWITWQGKRQKLSKFCYESGVLDTVDSVDYFPPEKLSLQDYTKEPERDYVTVDKCVYLNIFKPYSIAPRTERTTITDVRPFVDYVQDIYGTTPEKHNYIMAWLANLIQSPALKPRTYPIIIGPQGAGKSFLFEHFIRPILGNAASVTTDDMEGLLSNFNSLIEGRTLVVFEEAINHNKREVANKLKQLVTGNRMVLKKKFEPEREINSFIRPVFISNDEEQAVSIDSCIGERRACVIKVSDKFVGNREYFNNLVDWAKHNLDKVHRYLMDYRYSMAELNTAIVTEEKATMQKASMIYETPEVFWIMERLEDGFPLDTSKPREWSDAFVHEDIEYLLDAAIIDNAKWPNRISAKALRQDLQDWAHARGLGHKYMQGKVKERIARVLPYLAPTRRVFYTVMLNHKATQINPIVYKFPSKEEIIEHLKREFGHVLSKELLENKTYESDDYSARGTKI